MPRLPVTGLCSKRCIVPLTHIQPKNDARTRHTTRIDPSLFYIASVRTCFPPHDKCWNRAAAVPVARFTSQNVRE